MVAALFVAADGPYIGLPDVDPWTEERDARLYPGPHPVVAHPPCQRWCRLAGLVEARWGHKRGEDGGCFAAALASVRKWGGVLEHPAYSDAWAVFDMPVPARHGWTRSLTDLGWATEVSQSAYGHRARKRTWLYYVGEEPPPLLDWSEPHASVWVSWGDYDRYRDVERMPKWERSATPAPFRDLLLGIARAGALHRGRHP